MRIRKFLIYITIFSLSSSIKAQSVYPTSSKFDSFRQNTVSVMAAAGDTVWIGPSLDYNINNGAEWFHPTNIDSISSAGGRTFSLSVKGKKLVAGLGINIESVVSGFGYYISEDSGESWSYSFFPKDENPADNCDSKVIPYDGSCDLEFTYGGESYFRVRNTVAQQSPPYDVDFKDDVILSASWASGLLRSTDFGQTWQKVILPPMVEDSLSPSHNYSWNSQYQGNTIERYDPRTDFNLIGFGVLIDSQGRSWFGTAGGINISRNALTAPTDSISWRHNSFKNTSDGLLGNWIVAIKEDKATGKIWMTNWVNNAQDGERFGIVATDDEGITFEQHLIGQKINDLDIKDGVIYAAGTKGLFISKNAGQSWTKIPQIKSPNAFLKSDTEFYAVAATTDRVWIGSSDGLISTNDKGDTWEITRVDFPLSGGNVYQPKAKSVDAYAYPNPFSPTQHKVVRIKYELKKQGKVHIRIFDFGMNLVRDVENNSFNAGTYEAVWEGIDGEGRKVANGVYFYIIEMPNRTINGKILLIE